MGFLKFRHVDGDEIALAAVEKIGERKRGFSFADAAGADKHEDADRLDGIVHAGAVCGNALGDRFEGVVLADDPGCHEIFQVQSTVLISSCCILPTGMPVQAEMTSPTICVSTQTRMSGESPCNASSSAFSFSSSARRAAESVAGLSGRSCRGRHARGAAAAERWRRPNGSSFELRANVADARNERQFFIAAFFESLEARGDFRFLLGDGGEAFGMIDADSGFAFEDALLDFEVVDLAQGVFDHRRRGVLSEREARACGVHYADGFVRKLAACEIAMGELCGGADRFVKNSHVVVFLERANDAAQHDHALFFGGLFDFDNLEAASKRGIFFEEFFVFGPGGGGDRAQFAASQCRLEKIRGIALPCRAAGADHGVGFVNEENDGRRRGFHLFDQPLEAILEFAFDAGASLQEREIERADGDVLERRRNIACCNTQRKTFDDGGLAHARFTGEDGIVLTATSKNVDDLADLVIAAEDGVDLPGFGIRREIDRELIEILLLPGRGNACSALRQAFAADGNGLCRFLIFGRTGDDVPEIIMKRLGADFLKLARDFAHEPRKIAGAGNRENTEAGADLRGAEIERADVPSSGKHVRERWAERGCAGISGLQLVETAREIAGEPGFVDTKLLEDARKIAIGDVKKLEKKMLELDVVVGARQAKARCGFECVPAWYRSACRSGLLDLSS